MAALRAFLQIIAIVWAAEAAVFLLRSSQKLTPRRIYELMLVNAFGAGGAQVDNLADQEAYTYVGARLLIASILAELVFKLFLGPT